MKVVKNNRYSYLVLIIFIMLCIFLICNKNSDSKTLDEVKLSNKEENIISKELFAIMLGDEEGNYTESGSNAFPTEGYTYNAELSGCIDTKGNLVSDIMTYDTTNNLVTVSTDTTVYCYLYFDVYTIPKVTAIAIDNNTSSSKIEITSTKDGTYCVNTSSTLTDMSNCVASGSIVANTVLTTDVLTKSDTYYVRVKDSKDNIGISEEVAINYVLCNTGTLFGECLQSAKTNGFNSSLEGGLYRYQGENGAVDNYVCFGTTSKDECLADTDAHMYRIIGVNSSGQVKLIKKETLNSSMQWYSSYYKTDITWPNSIICSSINGSLFYTNTTYVPTSWQSKIATYSWKYGDIDSDVFNENADNLYATENAWTSTVSAKVGLMYAHDYYYSQQAGGKNCSYKQGEEIYLECVNGWIHLSQNVSNSSSTSEWIMVRDSNHIDNYYFAFSIYKNGYISLTPLDIEDYVRPTFYLTTSVNYISGSGTLSDPFIIS